MYRRLSTFSRKWSIRSLSLLAGSGLLIVGLLLNLTSAAHAASPAFVQTKNTSVGSSKTASVALSSTTSGNLIAVYLDWNSTANVTITDNKGNTYTSAGSAVKFGSALNASSQVFYAKNIAGGATTVTATFAANTGIDLYVQEYSGLDKTNPLDKSTGTRGNSNAPNSGSVTTTNAQDLLFGAGATMSSSMTPGSGYTARSTALGNMIEDKNVTATGMYSATTGLGATAQWVMHIVAFKAASTADTTAPSVPAGLSASATSSTQINLTWSAATDNVGVTGYKVYRNGAQITTTTGTSYQDTTLTPSTAYTYTVSAYDAAGNNSAQSAPVTATTLAPPDTAAPSVPANVQAVATSSSQVSVSWDAATDNVGVASYKLYRNGNVIATVTNGTTYTDSNLTANTAYTYTVAAMDAAGNTSPQSTPVAVTTLSDTTAPSAPANLSASATSSTQINLTWSAATDDTGVAGYKVSRDGVEIATVTSETAYQDAALTPSTAYTYTVTAYDAAGNVSAPSQPATGTTQAPPDTTAPSAPTNLVATAASSSQINLSWSAATDDRGVTAYKVSRGGTEIATTPTTTYNDTGLSANTAYTYTVTAVDAAGNVSAASNSASATTNPAQQVLTNRPAQAAVVMYGDGGSTSRASTYAHPGGLAAAGRTNYSDQVFKDISAAGGTELIYLDPIINNSYGRYHDMLINASECGPAVPLWPGNPQANQYGYLNDFRVGGVLQSKLECVLEKMVSENPQMGGWFIDDTGSRSWFPNFNWSTWGSTNQQAYRNGAIAITQTVRNVANRHGLMFIVNGTWTAGSLSSSGGGYPDMNQSGNALADGGFVEHHDASELSFWKSYACSPQWATQSPVTRGTAFMWAVTTTDADRDAYANSNCFAFVNNQPTANYDYVDPWGTFHPTGLPTQVGGPVTF